MADGRAVRRLGAGLALPEEISAFLSRARAAISRDPLPLEDASAVAYLTLALGRPEKPSHIRQVVVDEAQDYGALDYAVLNRLNPRARFTVLGDVNQALDRRVGLSLYDQIARALNRRTHALVTLEKSFRCTREILEFSLRFLDDAGGVESFSRSGEPPAEAVYHDMADAKTRIGAEIGRLRAAGMGSVALIAETGRAARVWAEALGLPLVEPGGEVGTTGVFLIPLALSKGLEFDAVLVLDAKNWREKRHLYVACTRALHRLRLFSPAEDGREDQ
jgi:DNA helicase-2/ATP-dependent DNA helicase PcrA